MRFFSGIKIVSVIVPCLDEEQSIADVVRDIAAQGVDEIIVVDNGSSDETVDRAAQAGARIAQESTRGYGRACAKGVASVRDDCDIVCFLDGDGSDIPSFIGAMVRPIAEDNADFVIGSRLLGKREQGSMTPQQIVAGWVAGKLLRLAYGVCFTDMSPFRALSLARLRSLPMTEMTYGWNLEMQMLVASLHWRILEIPVDHRCRTGGVSKVSGNLFASLAAALKIAATFARLLSWKRNNRLIERNST